MNQTTIYKFFKTHETEINAIAQYAQEHSITQREKCNLVRRISDLIGTCMSMAFLVQDVLDDEDKEYLLELIGDFRIMYRIKDRVDGIDTID